MLCTRIGHSIGTENLVPEEVNYTKIAIRVTVMNKVQFLLASLRASGAGEVRSRLSVLYKQPTFGIG